MITAAKILLIDDDAGIIDTLSRVLKDEGFEVEFERRGDDASRSCRARDVNVCEICHKMPVRFPKRNTGPEGRSFGRVETRPSKGRSSTAPPAIAGNIP